MSDDFRARARAWLAANAPRRASGDDEADAESRGQAAVIAEQKAFQAKLYDAGFMPASCGRGNTAVRA